LQFFALLYSGLDIWQQGQWNTTGIIRFSLGYLTLTYLSYMLAISNMRSYRRLEKQHKDQLSKHKKIEKIANIDSVTGVYSRHYLNQQIKKLPLKELAKLNSNIVFFIVQIDWFKNYVDYYGYEKGDILLNKISQIISNQMMPVNGSVYRITGSQFAGLVISYDVAKTLILINEIQALVDKENFPNTISQNKKVHVSIGITLDNNFEKFNFSKVFRKADEALFESFESPNKLPIVLDNRSGYRESTQLIS